MKVVLATPLYPPESGGPATYAKLLKEHLLKSEGNDEVVLVKFSEVRHLTKFLGIRHIAYFWRVLQTGKKADVIFALDPVSTGFPAALAARILGKPFVVKIVGDFAWEQGTQRFGVTATLDEFVLQERTSRMVALFRGVQTFVARSATRVIVPSNYLKGIITAWSSKIPPEKISVIYNSIELPELPSAMTCAESLIVSAGRLVPWKGMEGLIDAVVEVQKKIPNVSLTIVGDGPDKKMLEEKGKTKLSYALSFTGALTHAETLRTMDSATVYVQNSSYEGLSHQLIETLMLGKAIIATNVGGNPELIENNVNGLLVPFGDQNALVAAITKLLEDAEMRARLGARAKESASRFQVAVMIEQTRGLLSSIISSNSNSHI